MTKILTGAGYCAHPSESGYPARVLNAVAATAAAALAALAPGASTAPQAVELGPRTVLTGLSSPVGLAAPRSERGRLYVVEQGGTIRVVVGGKLRSGHFLDVRSRVRSGGEQGLLGLAFHPDYATNRRFYVNYTDRNGHTNVVEYRSNGTRALPGSARRVLFVRQPYGNHNGGGLAFGPDGALYVGMGDGGSGGDPENRSQNMGTRLGKLLRIDVDRRPSPIRIAALGLRNPWRFSFDRTTGDLYVADVGQNALEEINFLPRARLSALQNYGWDVYEGRATFEDKALGPGRLVMPVAQYGRNEGCSVTGGLSYRGSAKTLQGRYFYGDYCTGNVWSLKVTGGTARTLRRERFRIPTVTSFGEDAAGELFAVSHGGTLYRLTP
jgi:glucose/arabinose dehydrogenase